MPFTNFLGSPPIPTNLQVDKYKEVRQQVQNPPSTDSSQKSFQQVLKSAKPTYEIPNIGNGIPTDVGNSIQAKASNTLQSKQTSAITQSGNTLQTNVVNGTDLAKLREIAIELANQLEAILWSMAFETVNANQAGFGERLFSKELVTETVKDANKGNMGELATSIYDELKGKLGASL